MDYVHHLIQVPKITFNDIYQQARSFKSSNPTSRKTSVPKNDHAMNIVSPFSTRRKLINHQGRCSDQCEACKLIRASKMTITKHQFRKKTKIAQSKNAFTVNRQERATDTWLIQKNRQAKVEQDEQILTIVREKMKKTGQKVKQKFKKNHGIGCNSTEFQKFVAGYLSSIGPSAYRKFNTRKLLEDPLFLEALKKKFYNDLPKLPARAYNKKDKKKQQNMRIAKILGQQILKRKDKICLSKVSKTLDSFIRKSLDDFSEITQGLVDFFESKMKGGKQDWEKINQAVYDFEAIAIDLIEKNQHSELKISQLKKVMEKFHINTSAKFLKSGRCIKFNIESEEQSSEQRKMYSSMSIMTKSMSRIQSSKKKIQSIRCLEQSQQSQSSSEGKNSLFFHQMASENSQKDEREEGDIKKSSESLFHIDLGQEGSKSIEDSKSRTRRENVIFEPEEKEEGMNNAMNLLSKMFQSHYKNDHKRSKLNSFDFLEHQSLEVPQNVPSELNPIQLVRKQKEKQKSIARIKAHQHLQAHSHFLTRVHSEAKGTKIQSLIINQTDSLFTRKKKIRAIRDMCKKKKGDLDSELLDDLLNYLDIYEDNYRILMSPLCEPGQKGPNTALSARVLFGKLPTTKDLMFIDLNKDYIYGEAEEKQLQFGKNRKMPFPEELIAVRKKKKSFVLPDLTLDEQRLKKMLMEKKCKDELLQIGFSDSTNLQMVKSNPQTARISPQRPRLKNTPRMKNLNEAKQGEGSFSKRLLRLMSSRRTMDNLSKFDESIQTCRKILLTQNSKLQSRIFS